eukprot:4013257-Prymnesium_polylepis.1
MLPDAAACTTGQRVAPRALAAPHALAALRASTRAAHTGLRAAPSGLGAAAPSTRPSGLQRLPVRDRFLRSRGRDRLHPCAPLLRTLGRWHNA